MTRREIRNILEDGWAARREKLRERKERACEQTKKWVEREKKIKSGIISELPKRRRNYLS